MLSTKSMLSMKENEEYTKYLLIFEKIVIERDGNKETTVRLL